MDDNKLWELMAEIMLNKSRLFDFKNVEIMKLLMCLDCGDIFNLTNEIKACGCGKTTGQYIDNLNAEYSGNCKPIGFANGSFMDAIKIQRIENKSKKPKHECCKGV